MKIDFLWAVVDGWKTTGYFRREQDALAFARKGETVIDLNPAVRFGFKELSVPRRDLSGQLALTPSETIGVW